MLKIHIAVDMEREWRSVMENYANLYLSSFQDQYMLVECWLEQKYELKTDLDCFYFRVTAALEGGRQIVIETDNPDGRLAVEQGLARTRRTLIRHLRDPHRAAS